MNIWLSSLGAIVAPVQLERIRSLVATGTEEGARCWQPSWADQVGGDQADFEAAAAAVLTKNEELYRRLS